MQLDATAAKLAVPTELMERYESIATALFGSKFAQATVNFVKAVGEDEKAHVAFDEKADPPRLREINLRPDWDDASIAHEVGHAYHCLTWPDRTVTSMTHILEAVAMLAEATWIWQEYGCTVGPPQCVLQQVVANKVKGCEQVGMRAIYVDAGRYLAYYANVWGPGPARGWAINGTYLAGFLGTLIDNPSGVTV